MTRSTAGDPAAGSGSQPPVFFASPPDLARDLIVLAGPEGRHAADVRRLAAGENVSGVAGELGYNSASAFIAMFRRELGQTPKRYFEA